MIWVRFKTSPVFRENLKALNHHPPNIENTRIETDKHQDPTKGRLSLDSVHTQYCNNVKGLGLVTCLGSLRIGPGYNINGPYY